MKKDVDSVALEFSHRIMDILKESSIGGEFQVKAKIHCATVKLLKEQGISDACTIHNWDLKEVTEDFTLEECIYCGETRVQYY